MSLKTDYLVRLSSLSMGDRRLKTLDEVKANNVEVAIGKTIRAKGIGPGLRTYEVVLALKNGSCKGCDFLKEGICQKVHHCPCSAYSRADKTWVIFKEIQKNGTIK